MNHPQPDPVSPSDVLTFWREAGPRKWFSRDEHFDQEIRDRFEAVHLEASRRRLDTWADTPEGALALLILLDQFPRNLFRESAHAFATDSLALAAARASIARGFDGQVDGPERVFFYLPFEHSERLEDQDRCVELVQAWIDEGGDADQMRWVVIHRDIIARFGRFPHRNRALGRDTTPEEQAFLDGGGFKG